MEKLSKKQPINTLKDGDKINDIFVVKIKKSVASYTKGYFFTLILSDSSGGSIEYKYWGSQDEAKVKALFNSIKQDSVVLIHGIISTYKDKLQISANDESSLKVLKNDEYDAVFIMDAKKDIEQMSAQLMTKIDSIQNESLKKLLLNIFKDSLKEKFVKHPGAIQIHHNWLGGLLQHTLEVVDYCETCIKLNPSLDRDLLITGALLHDIGKLDELEMTSRIKGSRQGQFVGHLSLGSFFIYSELQKIQIDSILKEKLLHLLISHHGKKEFGSPKEPMIPEAMALYYSDELSSKLSEIVEVIKENKENTEDDFTYHFRSKTNIYLK